MSREITAIYVRVSTTKETQKDSPEHQRGLCEEKARVAALDVQYYYEDRGTGTSIVAREEIQRLIRDARNKQFGNVIFASLSRFSRDTLDSLNLKRILVDALGIRVISIEEGYDSFKDNDELKFQIISAVNQKLSEQISLSSKRGIRQSALKGNFTGSIVPYGFSKIQHDNRKLLIPNEESAQIVKTIFELYTRHKMGEKAIVHHLNNELEIPSPKGGLWGITSIQRMLTNEVYVGQNVFCKYEKKVVYNDINNMADRSRKQIKREESKWERSAERTHEPIIDDETFQAAQEIRLQRGGGKRGGVRNKANVFAGMIFCKHCNASLVMSKSKGRSAHTQDREYRYLICSTRRRQGERGCDNNLWIPYFDFRDTIIAELSNKMKLLINIEHHVSNFDGQGMLLNGQVNHEKEKKKLEKKIDANRKLLFELRKQSMQGEIDKEQFEFEKEMYENEIATFKSKLEMSTSLMNEQVDLEKLRDRIREALTSLANLNIQQIDEMSLTLSKLVEKLVVSGDGVVEIHTPLGQLEA